MKKKSYYLESLGCAKNTVDSESIASLLHQSGYTRTLKANHAEVLIVNTCGFIQPARDESIETLQQLSVNKKKGQILIAAGCLTERYREKLAREVKGLDGVLGTRRWMDILEVIQELQRTHHPNPLYHLPDLPTVGKDEQSVLRAAVQGGSAYLKIGDGCRRPCAFCSIPLIKGTAVSRPPEIIAREAKILQSMGMRELILIAQDTTDYGHDLGIHDGLPKLLLEIIQLAPEIPWIRLMYAYPGFISDDLIQVMTDHKQVLHYIDLPLQHAHPATLRRMRRPSNMDWVRSVILKLRSAMPDLALRTTFIVGYPGETESEFETLLDFIKEIQFDRVGVFEFSFEPGTTSEPLGDPIPKELKEERKNRLMELQQGISFSRNQAWIGKRLDVLVEGNDQGISVGRSFRDAPEIDGLVFIQGNLPAGEISPVLVNGAMPYDLTAQIYEAR